MSAAPHDLTLPPADALAAFEALLAVNPVGLALVDRGLRYVRVNARLAELNGRSVAEHLGRTPSDIFPPDLAAYLSGLLEGIFETGEPLHDFEIRIEAPPGSGVMRDLVAHYTPVGGPDGAVRWVAVTVVDVTEQTRAKAEIQARMREYETLAEHSPDLVARFDRGYRLLYVSPAVERAAGAAPGTFVGRTLRELGYPAHLQALGEAALERAFATGEPAEVTYEVTHRGPRHMLQARVVPERDADGRVTSILWVARDVTALHRSEERHRLRVAAAATVAWSTDAVGRFVEPQPEWALFTGDDWETYRGWGWAGAIHPDDRARTRAAWDEAVRARAIYRCEYRIRHAASGGWRHVLASAAPLLEHGGEVREWIGALTDIHERRELEAAQRRAEVRAEALVEQSAIPTLVYDLDGRVVHVNAAATAAFGFGREDLPPDYSLFTDAQLGAMGLLPLVRRAYAGEAVRADPVRYDLTRTTATGAGGAYWVQFHFYPIRDAEGRVELVVLTAIDVSALKEAEAALLASQRLEAVGRLAGGVAHETNNALQGVLGFGAFALRRLAPGDPVRADVEQMVHSGERAARIAQQLLAFSRRQVLQPEPVDLGRVVADFAPMLRQALGPGRELALAAADGAPAVVHADRGQVEQVLLNLALNARDAMTRGGRLTIAVEPGAAGRPARLVVEDTGHGMDEATCARIFEPFFTTKAVGEGSGLGLAVVHGIVEQSGGAIRCESRPGEGTRFTIELPAGDGPGVDAGAANP